MSKITIDRAVVEEALDLLDTNYITQRNVEEVIASIRAALEQPEQEPVAWMCTETGVLYDHDTSEVDKHHGFKPTVPLYAHPPTPRKPLTQEQRTRLFLELMQANADGPTAMFTLIVQAVERAHGITGEGAA